MSNRASFDAVNPTGVRYGHAESILNNASIERISFLREIPLMLDNRHIFKSTVEIDIKDEKSVYEVSILANRMAKFAADNKYVMLAANQVGYNCRMGILLDNGPISGFSAYVNAKLVDADIDINNDLPASLNVPYKVVSFPEQQLIIPIKSKIKVVMYDLIEDKNDEFEGGGTTAEFWQIMISILDGVDKSKLVSRDFMTIKGSDKIGRNKKCSKCGKKNKKCACGIESNEIINAV